MSTIKLAPLQAEYDLVIVGSGGGAIPAALVAKQQGKTAVILEKMDKVGGSTSFSGGVLWIPNHPLLAEAGVKDSYEQGRTYLDAVVDYVGPAVTSARKHAFLKAGPRMIDALRQWGMKLRRPNDTWPDYYDTLPGGLPQGRSIMAEPFNLHELGEWENRLALYPPMAMLPLGTDEFTTMFLMKRNMAGKMKAAKLGWLMLKDKLTKRQTVTNGAAIQGRMLQIALREGVNLRPDTPVKDFIVEGGQVVGVIAEHAGQRVEVRARDGVIVNVGGFSRNAEFRAKHMRAPSSAENTTWAPRPIVSILRGGSLRLATPTGHGLRGPCGMMAPSCRSCIISISRCLSASWSIRTGVASPTRRAPIWKSASASMVGKPKPAVPSLLG
jgi:3-oxosteroid 1-dehydrogenase